MAVLFLHVFLLFILNLFLLFLLYVFSRMLHKVMSQVTLSNAMMIQISISVYAYNTPLFSFFFSSANLIDNTSHTLYKHEC